MIQDISSKDIWDTGRQLRDVEDNGEAIWKLLEDKWEITGRHVVDK